jgi:hypothetical protein
MEYFTDEQLQAILDGAPASPSKIATQALSLIKENKQLRDQIEALTTERDTCAEPGMRSLGVMLY